MVKFAKTRVRPNVRSAITTIGELIARTHEGARAYRRDAKSELFLLAVTNMVSAGVFYETGVERDRRFVRLVGEVTAQDPQWVQRFVPWLRNTERLRFRDTQSVLRTIAQVESRIGGVGHGTNLGRAIKSHYRGHDRVVVFSDMQTHDQVPELRGAVVYVFNTGGYGTTPLRVGDKGHYELGGFTDATFRLMAALEDTRDTGWPF